MYNKIQQKAVNGKGVHRGRKIIFNRRSSKKIKFTS